MNSDVQYFILGLLVGGGFVTAVAYSIFRTIINTISDRLDEWEQEQE